MELTEIKRRGEEDILGWSFINKKGEEYVIWRKIVDHSLAEEQARELALGGTIELKGLTSKKGNKFDALASYCTKEKKVILSFPERETQPVTQAQENQEEKSVEDRVASFFPVEDADEYEDDGDDGDEDGAA